ncbi:MAG TPA: hypothetical protein VGS11_09220 [Candidatus Bathyarchaeia archaeon]|nr:hypothetical protein [Candidatus Bathyarchaeia archaeon]
MTRRFAVKKEIRILGLDFCNPRRQVGAVVRGGHYLDGIVVFPARPIPQNRAIASAILRTRFFPELRLIMVHHTRHRLDAKVIEKLTKLPVVEVASANKRASNGFESYKIGSKKSQIASSLPSETLQEILSTTWLTGTLPEPLRIAHLVSRSRIFSGKRRVSKPTNKFAF